MIASSQQTANPALELERLAILMHPAMKLGDTRAHSNWITAGQDNSFLLSQLYQRVSQHNREAGRAYWAIRCWSAICWQPLFMAVAAVHGAGWIPDLTQMQLEVQEFSIYGYSFSSDKNWKADLPSLIRMVGEQLQILMERLQADLRPVCKLNRILAQGLIADTLMEAVARIPRLNPQRDGNDLTGLSQLWLAAMDLTGKSELVAKDGQWVVKRHSCCLHYRIDPDDHCSNCPTLNRRAILSSVD